ncbi:MAG TPA: PQQ-binding-like beta-propeller repeat protein [Solirubrobacterales bacterium]|nr:PQQ-binding-like beta-propeller repeat protein [Solirubrobacterales bacterium]
MKEKDLGLKFWAAVAVSAIGMGVAIAFVAGFFLGHFTGHHNTTTVVAGATTSTESTTSEETNEGEPVTASNGIVLAPKFTSEELGAQAGEDWITNGGGTTNDRFSSLNEINTSNVAQLKGDWMTKIGQNAISAKFSAEGQALEYKGTIYISDGADDVFALNASSGKILWTYEPHLPPDPLGEVVCCGWDNRGVAIGDGMVFVSQLNGDQVALDQETGKVKWNTEVVKPGSGFSITSAPLYYNGKVYVGGSGGEYGVRGRLTALNAETGEMEWHFYTTPSPQETGGNAWPNNGSYKHGGASLWNTPTVNPETGTLFFSTSNASPWIGSEREGDNLFTASIVALNAESGKLQWAYQQVHHDLWDFDSPSPTVLFKGEMNGEMREGVGEPSKTGWLYLVDQKTGKPIYPIPEVKVPQDPSEKTSATQPEPSIPPFSPIEAQPEAVEKAEEAVAGDKPKPKIVGSKIFTPMSSDPSSINLTANSAVGGDNWPPSSFDSEKDMYFVCSQSGALGLVVPPKPQKFVEGETYIGSDTIVSSGFDTVGYLTGYDMSTGKIAWQDKFPKESCYSGAVTTAGGLLFVGHNDGNLVAYDVETGEEVWHFQTGAGANTTVTPFEEEGEEKIAFYAGGNSLAATAHGENFWVFSLNGTMEEAKGLEAEEEGGGHAGEETPEQEAEKKAEAEAEESGETGEEAGTGEEEGKEEAAAGGGGATADASAGKEVFSEECSVCHGATGHGGNGGPDLRTMPLAKTQEGAEQQVTNGGGGMPPFKGVLSEEEIANVAAYVSEDIVGGK